MDALFRHPAVAVLALCCPLLFCCWTAAANTGDEAALEDARLGRMRQLVERLGDDDYFVRQRAEEELAEYGFEAFDVLMKATDHRDLEVAARARRLLRLLTVSWAGEHDPPEVHEILADFATRSGAEKLVCMDQLAELQEGAGVAALCRLVRFEQSPVLSKHAALAVLAAHRTADAPPEPTRRKILQRLSGSRRPAAVWLSVWAEFQEDPAAAVERWAGFVREEEALLGRDPSETRSEIVAGLAHRHIRWLRGLDRKEDALAATRVLIRLEEGDPDELLELLDWLVAQQAWPLVDELADRFDEVFARTPLLLYTLADAQLAQANQAEAERTAQQALEIYSGNEPDDLHRHGFVAESLRERGQIRWAIEEYRHVIDNGAPGTRLVVAAQSSLSEMLHDQGEDLKAAETIESMLAAVEKPPEQRGGKGPPGADPFGRSAADAIELDDETRDIYRARMYYFLACHHEAEDDRARQREFLDKSLETGEADIDVLIACHRLPDAEPDYRRRIAKLIAEETARLQENILAEPLLPTWYNQYAWLVGNTDGDLDTALKYSKRSLEIQPDSGGYYDTLAHVYFARGEYEKAVEAQTKAVELEPHSGLIQRQFRVFEKKLEETRKKKP